MSYQSRPIRALFAALIGVALLTVAACSSDDEPEANALTIAGTEFGFKVTEGALSPGTNNITFVNDGGQVHHLQLVQLLEGFPAWMHFAGGVGQVAPGGSGTVIADVAEGNYVFLCFVPDTDGAPHFAKGMIAAVSTEGEASEAHIPDATVTLNAVDYGFEAPASLKAGEDIVIELTNNGTELHEVNLVQLAPNTTVADFLAGLSPDATEPPPGLPIGGIQGILPGESQRATLNLAAGNYALICYIPNAEGAPHFALGMATALEVTE
ncbi:MAG: hypothetical protein HOH95_06615 [Dehalococcoidia bacterium]|nr:hypothetical protein [Dehalococcoidia bacterium]